MRIGIFTQSYVPTVNGVVTILQLMLRELTKLGHDVHIFCPRYPGYVRSENGVHRMPSVRFMFYDGMRMPIPFSRETFRLLPTLDVIHTHDPGPMGWLGLWASRRYGIPHVHTYHTLLMDYRRYLPPGIRPTRDLIKRLSRSLDTLADAVIAPSHQMRKELHSYGMVSTIHTLPFGLDQEDYEKDRTVDVRRALNLPDEDLLLYAGRIAKEKNLEFLVRAFGKLLESRPSARLIIAGDGPHHRAVHEYVHRLGLERRIIFTGFLDRATLIDFYKQASLFVFPSMTETQGLVVMEAMMAGAPVVAVNVLGPVDVIRHDETGILVNPDEDEFAAACARLLDDHERRGAIGAAARRWAQTHTSGKSVGKLLDIYRECIEKRATPPC